MHIPEIDVTAMGPTRTPIQRAMELIREHGPVLIRRQGNWRNLLVSDLDLVAELSDEDRFAKHVGPALENVREFAADGLFTAYNDEPNWGRAHDILMPAFAMGSMRAYHPVMLDVARRVIDSWDRAARDGAPVDVPGDMTRMTLDTIGLAGFGYDFGSFDSREPHPFVAAMVRCLEWSMTRLGRRPDASAAESAAYAAADQAFRADADFLAGVVDEVIAARRAAAGTGAARPEREDLLGLMLSAPHPSDGRPLDDANIRNQVITFLIAGHETTSGALSFALYYLAKHPTAARLVEEEADALWGGTADPLPGFEEIGRLPYTRQVLNEALRLWPTAAAFSREAREDTVLGAGRWGEDGRGIPLRAGEGVTVLSPMLHRQPVWGDNPELFDPDRFTPQAEAARPVDAYKPFGTGERACIGRQFALHEATMLLALLAHRYRFLDHADYRLDVKETLTLKPEGFTLRLRPRTERHRAGTAAATAARPENAATGRLRAGTGVLLLHGSNYGTCRELAQQLALDIEELGGETETAALDAYPPERLPADRPVVIVAASYNGRPTDDAAAFVAALEAADGGCRASYAVLGVGDRNWAATYQRIPTLIDARLAELGGIRLTDRAAADASGDLGATVREFGGALRNALLDRYGDPDAVAAPVPAESGRSVRVLPAGPLDALAARHRLAPLRVLEARDLTAPEHPRTKRFLRLALPEGETYRTGDHLAVLPANDPDAVERLAKGLDLDLDAVLDVRDRRLPVDRPLTARALLTRHLELNARLNPGQLELLAAADPCPPERAALAAGSPSGTLAQLAERYPALRGAVGWELLLELLPPLRPRHYSISSAPGDRPGEVDLMVSLLERADGCEGTGSGYLARRVLAGDTVLAGVRPGREAFRIPAEEAAERPVVMVAAGTGLAPFRGVVAERAALAARGARLAPALLFFGCDREDRDFLHAGELRAAEAAGAVAVRPAFSEAGDPVRFVQHRIAAEAEELWPLLAAGARVHVCGDGSRMAPAVRAAFRDLAARHGRPDWLEAALAAGDYQEDVYTG
ncbi:cytochrome P450 [Phaeacidiphilus oryzae]|uniref:cytochrome P450 n=1 Tax=Phaeacidiphilus oryzae TaxID=348818 RepID=UPI00068DAE9C|nr:cytochrome P450 [Phaeacidiphilus oryzae]